MQNKNKAAKQMNARGFNDEYEAQLAKNKLGFFLFAILVLDY
jgi:hypothetical protein